MQLKADLVCWLDEEGLPHHQLFHQKEGSSHFDALELMGQLVNAERTEIMLFDCELCVRKSKRTADMNRHRPDKDVDYMQQLRC